MKSGIVVCLFLSVLFSGTVFGENTNNNKSLANQAAKQSEASEIIVKFKDRNVGLNKIQTLGSNKKQIIKNKIDVISVPKEKNQEQFLNELKADLNVEYAEINGKMLPTATTPNDTNYPNQWYLPKIQAPDAWDAQQGSSGNTVAIIDTGVDLAHADLSGRMWVNSGETNCSDLIDNDTNGYADDCNGWDFVTCSDYNAQGTVCVSPKIEDNSPQDECGHGTAVAGIIGAATNNASLIAGINWNAKIMAIRALGSPDVIGGKQTCPGDWDVVANAIYYAADNGADVINMSFGGGDSQTIQDAIDYAYSAGAVLVASSGNSGTSGVSFPAAYPNVVAVGATNSDDSLASFSATGPELDVVAPGTGLPTLDITNGPGNVNGSSAGYASGNYLGSFSGTSAAAPVVSGAISLLIAQYPALTPAEIIDRALSSSDKVSGMSNENFLSQYGFGRINLLRALTFTDKINPNATLIKSSDSPNVYLIESSQKKWIGSPAFFKTRYNWEKVLVVPQARVERYTNGNDLQFPDGSLIKGDGPSIYVLENNQKRWIESPEIFSGLGYRWENIINVSSTELDRYAQGSNVTNVLVHPNSTILRTADSPKIYYIEGGQKRHIGSPSVFNAQFYSQNIITISNAEMTNYPTGQDMHYPNGTLIKGTGPEVYLLDSKQKRWITSPEMFEYLNYDWSDIIIESSAEVNYYSNGENI